MTISADDYPPRPDDMAMLCRDRIADLEVQRASATRQERRPINKHLHACRELLAFATTRAGYTGVVDPKSARFVGAGRGALVIKQTAERSRATSRRLPALRVAAP